MPLTQNGYTKSSATEIKQKLIDRIRLQIPDFSDQPADLQNNLIDTSVEAILLYEDMMADLFNAMSPSFANKDLFRKFAESLGLRPKEEFKAQATLTFSGKFGDLIPQGCIVSPVGNDSVSFITQEAGVISTTGEVSLLATSETTDTFQPNSITNIKSVLTEGVTCTNKAASLKYIPAETDEQLTARAQAKLRSARQGGKLYAVSTLNGVEGVDSRLVAFYDTQTEQMVNNNKMYVKGIEAVVGGGKDEEVALALYKSFLETQKLISVPSNNETNRAVLVVLYVHNNPVKIHFTRPKLVEVGISLNLAFSSSLSSPVAIQALTEKTVTAYINSLQVGIPISQYALIEKIIPILTDAGIPAYTLTNINFTYKIGATGAYGKFDSNGFIPEIEKDCYAILIEYGVTINAEEADS